MNIKCKIKLEEGAKMPTRAHDTDTGYDVYAKDITIIYTLGQERELTPDKPSLRDHILTPDKLGKKEAYSCLTPGEIFAVFIDTGIAITPQHGYACIAAAQSRLAKSGWYIANGIGVIDNGYRGTIKFVYKPDHTKPLDVDLFALGKKCGQLIFHEVTTATFEQVDELPATARGTGGFGSTGTH